eukprot:scaffold54230_cov79-Phaeocystis_antarctica.AAC.1
MDATRAKAGLYGFKARKPRTRARGRPGLLIGIQFWSSRRDVVFVRGSPSRDLKYYLYTLLGHYIDLFCTVRPTRYSVTFPGQHSARMINT